MSRTVLQHFSEHFPTTEVSAWQPLGGGCISSAAKLTTNRGFFFVKWNTDAPHDLFTSEAHSLRCLKAAGTPLKIPEVLLATPIEADRPSMLVTEFLAQGSANDALLGEGLAALHALPQTRFGFGVTTYCGATPQDNTWADDWATFYAERRLGFLLEQLANQRALPAKDRTCYERLCQKMPELLPKSATPALVHGDLWSGNCMHTSEGPALIDPACSYADREFDFGILCMFGGFSDTFWQAYQHHYPLEGGWKERNLLYQLYNYLNHYALFGGSYGASALHIAQRFL